MKMMFVSVLGQNLPVVLTEVINACLSRFLFVAMSYFVRFSSAESLPIANLVLEQVDANCHISPPRQLR